MRGVGLDLNSLGVSDVREVLGGSLLGSVLGMLC